MADKLYISVTDTSNIISCTINDSHQAQTSTAFINAINTNLTLGDHVTIYMGYDGNYKKRFTGYVKAIEVKEPEKFYSITCANELIRAVDYFIASSSPNQPFTRSNIKAEFLVRDVLQLAGITNYSYQATSFTFAVHNPLEVNLTSAYDYSHFIADILAYNLYADMNGVVHFEDRRPYVMSGETSTSTITDSDILTINYTKSDRDIRNRVVVYGSGDIHAEASASSPYLPSGFYKTAVVAAPGVIDTQSMASQSASYNLNLLNRLTESVSIEMIGNPNIFCRDITHLVKDDLSITDDWYVYSCEDSWSKGGYKQTIDLRR